MSVHLADVITALDAAYPPSLAEDWDSVGLVCGDPADPVGRVLFAVDPTAAVVDEALAWGAQALVVHHPLLLRGVDTVGAHTPKGALVHKLIKAGCALFTAHTNADSADPGVSDALAAALGLTVTGVLDPVPAPAVDKWVVMVPAHATSAVQSALFAAGAGQLGEYSECSWRVAGTGQFRPLTGANPTLGEVGRIESVAEDRLELVARRSLRSAVLAALRAAHPYEEPAFDIIELASTRADCGLGRVGELPAPETLRAFTERVRAGLPQTVWGVRSAGDPEAVVRKVAVCGGAGDSFLPTVTRLGVDVYVTADLRHHVVDEHLRAGGPAVVDVAHWASEFPWCAQARDVVERLGGVETRISTVRTDPWTVGGYGGGSNAYG
ncbi:Nif3-like dinuclear metal center hexameric protein [Antrihabitans sp. YC2-6]|uniref:Nif3-like dinuclear metal center hexameric protein n=1 Tax=Antrihabitans sp. YC2-6 TaxID=2799498 RepID=UPI0018F53B08|nr:Nif3-like dinuclear metal center hexameric protein [Antrihabitans sp. YC2-6]MBJ8344869.1 Nif3-like dinuclear metal center hexameric protein [Antrihabitans sp. YC2-6]